MTYRFKNGERQVLVGIYISMSGWVAHWFGGGRNDFDPIDVTSRIDGKKIVNIVKIPKGEEWVMDK